MSEPPALDKVGPEEPSLNLLPEIQTPPPEDVAATPSELQIPCADNTSSQEAAVPAIETLTPPPDVDPSVLEGLVKDAGKTASDYLLALLHGKKSHDTSGCLLSLNQLGLLL